MRSNDDRPIDYTVGDMERSVKIEATTRTLCQKFDIWIEQHAKTHKILEPQVQDNTRFRQNSKAVYMWLLPGGGIIGVAAIVGKILDWY